MTKVTIENGCTVIRKPFDAEWAKAQLGMKQCVILDIKGTYKGQQGWVYIYSPHQLDDLYYQDIIKNVEYTVVANLEPLPKRPTPEDAPLLYRYMAEGIIPMAVIKDPNPDNSDFEYNPIYYLESKHFGAEEITHCLVNGERVEIAIDGGKDD